LTELGLLKIKGGRFSDTLYACTEQRVSFLT